MGFQNFVVINKIRLLKKSTPLDSNLYAWRSVTTLNRLVDDTLLTRCLNSFKRWNSRHTRGAIAWPITTLRHRRHTRGAACGTAHTISISDFPISVFYIILRTFVFVCSPTRDIFTCAAQHTTSSRVQPYTRHHHVCSSTRDTFTCVAQHATPSCVQPVSYGNTSSWNRFFLPVL